ARRRGDRGVDSESRRRRGYARGSRTRESARRTAHTGCAARAPRRVKVAVLTGGGGGARFLRGVVAAVDPADVTAIVNVGDDLEVLGLSVSPDLDSVLYALAGLSDDVRGWGRAEETCHALEAAQSFGGVAWFRRGDRVLGLHLVRTQLLRAGQPLSSVTARLAAAAGVEAAILPATDDVLRTWLDTPNGS